MVEFEDTQKRVNDCVVQTRCDKRTLATLTQYLIESRGYVISVSELVRISLETLEDIILNKRPDMRIASTEDADNMLNEIYKANLHPTRAGKGGRRVPTYNYSFRKQLDLEDAYIEGRDAGYVKPRSKEMEAKSKKSIDTTVRHLIMSGKAKEAIDAVESPAQAQKRREEEDADAKAALAAGPTTVVKGDGDENKDKV